MRGMGSSQPSYAGFHWERSTQILANLKIWITRNQHESFHPEKQKHRAGHRPERAVLTKLVWSKRGDPATEHVLIFPHLNSHSPLFCTFKVLCVSKRQDSPLLIRYLFYPKDLHLKHVKCRSHLIIHFGQVIFNAALFHHPCDCRTRERLMPQHTWVTPVSTSCLFPLSAHFPFPPFHFLCQWVKDRENRLLSTITKTNLKGLVWGRKFWCSEVNRTAYI